MAYDDQDVDRLLRALPAPGVPARTRERQLELLRAAMAADAEAPTTPQPTDAVAEPAEATVVPLDRARRRRRMVVAVVAAAAVGLGATAAATIAWQRASNRTEVRCFPAVVTDYDNPVYGDVTQIDSDSATAALDICSSLWSQDYLVSAYPYLGDGSRRPPAGPTTGRLRAARGRGGRVPHDPDLRAARPAEVDRMSAARPRAGVSTSWTPCNAPPRAYIPPSDMGLPTKGMAHGCTCAPAANVGGGGGCRGGPLVGRRRRVSGSCGRLAEVLHPQHLDRGLLLQLGRPHCRWSAGQAGPGRRDVVRAGQVLRRHRPATPAAATSP